MNGSTRRLLGAWVAAALLAAGCRRVAPPRSRTWNSMGTFATVTVGRREAGRLDDYAGRAARELRDLEAKLSSYQPASDVSRLNASAGGPGVRVSPATAAVLALSRHYAELSEGAFDVSVAPLMALWGFRGGPPAELPAATATAEARALVNWRGVRLDPPRAALERAGMRIDLGGIGKGYAVDACFEALEEAGAKDILVNLAGNMRARGSPEGDRAWRVGVRHPFDRDRLLGSVELSGGQAVATSGNYERFVTIDGRRYTHIMDPRTGRPVSGMAGVTVVSPSAAEADAVSTALFVMGLEAAPRLLARLPACEALVVPDRRPIELWATPGFRRGFRPAPGFGDRLRPLVR